MYSNRDRRPFRRGHVDVIAKYCSVLVIGVLVGAVRGFVRADRMRYHSLLNFTRKTATFCTRSMTVNRTTRKLKKDQLIAHVTGLSDTRRSGYLILVGAGDRIRYLGFRELGSRARSQNVVSRLAWTETQPE